MIIDPVCTAPDWMISNTQKLREFNGRIYFLERWSALRGSGKDPKSIPAGVSWRPIPEYTQRKHQWRRIITCLSMWGRDRTIEELTGGR